MEYKDQGTQKNAESTTACDNPFFSRASRVYLGRTWDRKGMPGCVDALVGAEIPATIEEEGKKIYLPILEVARAVPVLSALRDGDDRRLSLAAEDMLDSIDDHLRGLWRMSPEGLPIDKATETEIRALTGGYYPDMEGY